MNLADFHFAEPGWLWLAAAGPVLLAWLQIRSARARREQLAKLATANLAAELTASHSPARRQFKEFLLLAAVLAGGLAMARPQWGRVERESAFVGDDVVFAVDCSLSMTTTDVLPNRLQRAKFAILDFTRRQSHGRVGLVAFAGSAFLECPLTFDTGAFEETLMSLDEKTLPIPGTDIGRALLEADHALDKQARRKLVILITDGEDLEKSGIAAAQILATNSVVIFTVGVGTAAGSEIRTINPAGQPDFLRDTQGEIVRSRLDEATLTKIAQVTGGSYYPLGNLDQGLMKIGPAIQALENKPGAGPAVRNGVDRFYWIVGIMLLLLVAESIIGTRRNPTPSTA
jgi:Ca-activated chloride channel family protein